MLDESLSEICERFNDLSWHDSKLKSVSLAYTPEAKSFQLTLYVDLIQRYTDQHRGHYAQAEIRFMQARTLHTDLDLLGMTYCGGDIVQATCESYLDLQKKMSTNQSVNFYLPQEPPLDELKHFRILLVEPSGEINIIAKGFELSVHSG